MVELNERKTEIKRKAKEIDEIDRQILFELYEDGTKSPNRMKIFKGKNEMSHPGKKNRYDNLIKSNLLKIQGNININELDCNIAYVKLEFKTLDVIDYHLSKYENCPRIFLISRLTGQYHLMLGLLGKNLDDLNGFLNYCILSKKDEIQTSEIIFATDVKKPQYLPLNVFNIDINHTGCGKDCKSCNAFTNKWCFGCDFL